MKVIRVSEVHGLHGTASTSISQEATLEDVIRKFANEPSIRGVFLVDKEQRFAGMVSRIAILKWAEFRLSKKWENHPPDSETKETFGSVKASHLARGDRRSFGVKESDSIEEAFTKMINTGEDVIPVLDEEGRITGDLSLSEVLLKVIEGSK
jgi:CBS domain-containing protein